MKESEGNVMRQRDRTLARLATLGINIYDADALIRIAKQLHRWHERECGDDYGCIGRDEATRKPY